MQATAEMRVSVYLQHVRLQTEVRMARMETKKQTELGELAKQT